MTFLYDLAFMLFGLGYLPIFLAKTRQADNPSDVWNERFGSFSPIKEASFSGKKNFWIHAVSVGEVMAIKRFVTELLERWPDIHIVFTTVTPTGQKVAQSLACERVTICYFPFDMTFAVKRFFERIQPKAVFLMETEIWPNLLSEANKRTIPVGILNARLSERSAKRYRVISGLLANLFQKLSFVLAQTHDDAQRFQELGIAKEKVEVLGNMKFDNVSFPNDIKQLARSLRSEWGYSQEDMILIAGSTHPGEEAILVQTYKKLLEHYPSLKLIIAPRHIERGEALLTQLKEFGLTIRLATQTINSGSDAQVLILNKLGVLKNLYAIADVVYVGGSLVKHGGQNPIEPAAFQKPILHGPHIFNFQQIYRMLESQQAALPVYSASDLQSQLSRLLGDAKLREDFGRKAFAIIQDLQGATGRHLDWILNRFCSGLTERKENAANEKLFPSIGGRS